MNHTNSVQTHHTNLVNAIIISPHSGLNPPKMTHKFRLCDKRGFHVSYYHYIVTDDPGSKPDQKYAGRGERERGKIIFGRRGKIIFGRTEYKFRISSNKNILLY